MKNYNNPGSSGGRSSGSQGRPTRYPKGYLDKGYFDEDGYIRQELLRETAWTIAESFGRGLSNSQLRRFYGHVKTAEKSFLYSGDEKKFINDIISLDHFVAESKGKGNVPEQFYEFVHDNTSAVRTIKDIRKGLLPHFQAVVAYFTYKYPSKYPRS